MNETKKFEKIPIPSADIDYREVARLMRINIDILKKEITEHVDMELRRFHDGMENDD